MNDHPASSTDAPSALIEPSLAPIARWIGYGLLVLSLCDLIESMIPLPLLNAAWELQFMGTQVERSPVPVLGFLFVFFAEYLQRGRWQRTVALVLSWAALAVGVAFLLMIPLIVTNTFRLEDRATAQVNTQLGQQMSQAEKLETALTGATGQNLEELLKRMGRPTQGKTPEAVRAEVLGDLTKARQTLQDRAEDALSNQKLTLTKRSFKWAAQAVVVGILMIYLWRATAWLRRAGR
jgi:hypothetical protein